jgi:hypothetical protein
MLGMNWVTFFYLGCKQQNDGHMLLSWCSNAPTPPFVVDHFA